MSSICTTRVATGSNCGTRSSRSARARALADRTLPHPANRGGILAHGCDMTIEENPYEVGYGYKWMVELEQEQDFMGRDALREVHERVSTASWWASKSAEPSQGIQRRIYARLLPGPFRRSRDRARHIYLLFTAPGSQYRLRDGPGQHSELGAEVEIERPDQTVSGVVADRVFFKPEHAEQPLWTRASEDRHPPLAGVSQPVRPHRSFSLTAQFSTGARLRGSGESGDGNPSSRAATHDPARPRSAPVRAMR